MGAGAREAPAAAGNLGAAERGARRRAACTSFRAGPRSAAAAASGAERRPGRRPGQRRVRPGSACCRRPLPSRPQQPHSRRGPLHRPRTTRRMRTAGARRAKERGDRRAAILDRGHPRGQSRQPCAPRDPCRLRPPVHNSPGGAAPREEEPRALALGAPRVLIGPGTPRQHPPPRPALLVTIPGGPGTKQGPRPQRGMRSAPGMMLVGNKDLLEGGEGDRFPSWIYGLSHAMWAYVYP